jgi:hypothetical protein
MRVVFHCFLKEKKRKRKKETYIQNCATSYQKECFQLYIFLDKLQSPLKTVVYFLKTEEALICEKQRVVIN